MNIKKISLLCALLGAFVLIVVLLPPGMLSLDTLKIHQQTLLARVEQAPLQSALFYFAVYVLLSALSIPRSRASDAARRGAFQPVGGDAVGVICLDARRHACHARQPLSASRLGATALCRTDEHDRCGNGSRRRALPFALRLMPLFPFFLVNLLMGLTRLRVRHYWWVSQLAMLPATVIYLNAGRELGKLTSLRDILSPGLLFAFTLLGLLPLVTRWLFSRYIPSIKK